jgi:hypothetical protein
MILPSGAIRPRTPSQEIAMKPLPALVLLSCLASMEAWGRPSSPAEEEVLDAPGGKPIAILLPGAETIRGESKEGYVRIRLEGWVRAASAKVPESAVSPPASIDLPAPAAALSGTVAVRLESGEIRYGAGAHVAVLGPATELDRAWAELKEGYEKDQEELTNRILELDRQEKRALASSDNFTQATQNLDRIRAERRSAGKQREALRGRYAGRAEELFRRFQRAEAAADAAGRYSIALLPAGAYRILGTMTTDQGVRRWYVPVEVTPNGGASLDLQSANAGPDPFFGTK